MSYGPAPPYRQPTARPTCARCGADPGDAPFLSNDGRALCRTCFHAGSQAAANHRAVQSTAGGGLVHFGNEAATLQAGMQSDMDAKVLRRCARCNASAVTVVHVTFHYVNGLTRGRTYQHACGACGASFQTESVLRMLVNLGSGLIGAAIGAAAIGFASGWLWLMVLLLPAGLFLTGCTIARIVARLRNPIVPRLPSA